jgi:hypothetical protein
MTERNYAAELRAVIDAETAGGPYVSRAVAEHVVEKLRATDRELLSGWLDAQAEHFVWQLINDRDRSTRSHARASSKPNAFNKDAKATGGGDRASLARWLTVPFVVEDGSRKRLADMSKDDLLFVGDAYDAQARENKMTAAFMRAIARKVGTKTVKDHYTDEQLSVMWQSLASV